MNKFSTEQEAFWAGEFGTAYISRNDAKSIGSRTAIFSKILKHTKNVASVLEVGANIGLNLKAISNLIFDCKFSVIEINADAVAQLKAIPNVTVHEGSAFDFTKKELGSFDLTFTSGVLIHINPDRLDDVYKLLYDCSGKYIVVNEYYNPAPVEISYRGHSRRLFKRDFAGDMLDKFSDLELIDYGFQYHRDSNFPYDDCTWFLLRKKN